MAGPEVLLLDEPTLGLAPIVVKEVFQKVSEISERLNTTILVVEHNIKGVLNIVDRVYLLDKGRVVHEGAPQTVRETNILAEVFLGKVRPGARGWRRGSACARFTLASGWMGMDGFGALPRHGQQRCGNGNGHCLC